MRNLPKQCPVQKTQKANSKIIYKKRFDKAKVKHSTVKNEAEKFETAKIFKVGKTRKTKMKESKHGTKANLNQTLISTLITENTKFRSKSFRFT